MRARKKLDGRSDEQLRGEIAGAEAQLRQLQRANQLFVEDALAGIDKLLAEGRREFERRLARYHAVLATGLTGFHGGAGQSLIGDLAIAWATSSPEFGAALRAWVEQAPDGVFSPLKKAEFEAKLAKLEDELASHEAELVRRGLIAEREAVDARLQAAGFSSSGGGQAA